MPVAYHAHPVDDHGNLVNIGTRPDQSHPTATLIDAVIATVRQLEAHPRSLLVRGSIAAGTFVAGFSDADFIVVSEHQRPTDLGPACELLSQRFLPAVQGVDVGWLNEQTLMTPSRARLRVNLITSSVALVGIPAENLIAPIAPGRRLADELYPDLVEEIRSLAAVLLGSGRPPSATVYDHRPEYWAAWSLRVALRGTHSLVMRHRSIYQADLRKCAHNIGLAFPELGALVTQLMRWVSSPPEPASLAAALKQLAGLVGLIEAGGAAS